MNHPDANKWNQRYGASNATPAPCSLLQNHQYLLPTSGKALDLACGLGGNALLLAQHGLDTHAWDISDVAITKLTTLAAEKRLPIQTLTRDIERLPPPPNSFDCIVVSYFLERTICNAIAAALKPRGLLFYQTFSINKISDKGPSSERFLLKNNELIQLFNSLEVRFYQELGNSGDLNQGDRDTVQLIAQKPVSQ